MQPGSKDPGCAFSGCTYVLRAGDSVSQSRTLSDFGMVERRRLEGDWLLENTRTHLRSQAPLASSFNASTNQRIPLSHFHWTFVIFPGATSTSKGPKCPTPDVLPL